MDVHMDVVESYINNFENMHIQNNQQYRDVNILLLGETGVGKSTFINAIANYFRYENFDQAIKEELLILAPTLISLVNDKNEIFNLHLGSDDNKKQEVGAAGTTDVRSYFLPIQGTNLRLRLIDSPGMGDPDGIDQDDINMEEILTYLANLKELHAICFLMKPTTTRNNVLFEYCIKQLLSRLELSASQNIIFVFTNTRGAFYSAGDTLPCLKKIINDIKAIPPHVNIPFENNIFSLDNEAFKFQAAIKCNVELNSIMMKYATRSWDVSSKACQQLIQYIVGDNSRSPLKPHLMSKTIEVNKARDLIDQHTQPLVDACQLIDDNIRILVKHKDDLNREYRSLDELKQKLYIPYYTLEVVPLETSALICESSKCAKHVNVNGVNQVISNQICHQPCNLSYNSSRKFIRYSKGKLVKICHVISKNNCTICGCHYSTHRLVSNLKATVPDFVMDNVVKVEIDNKEMILEKRQQLIKEIDQKTKEHEEELSKILKSVAEFASFLQINSISAFTDSFIEEMKHLIEREKNFGKLGDATKIYNLEKILKKYEEARSNKENQKFISVGNAVAEIYETIENLYHLKCNGKVIKDLFEKQKKSKNWESNAHLIDNWLDIAVNKVAASTTASSQQQTANNSFNNNIKNYANRDNSKKYNENFILGNTSSISKTKNNTNIDAAQSNSNFSTNASIYPKPSLDQNFHSTSLKDQNQATKSATAINFEEQSQSTMTTLEQKMSSAEDKSVQFSSQESHKKPELTSTACQTDQYYLGHCKSCNNRFQLSLTNTERENYPPRSKYSTGHALDNHSEQEFGLRHPRQRWQIPNFDEARFRTGDAPPWHQNQSKRYFAEKRYFEDDYPKRHDAPFSSSATRFKSRSGLSFYPERKKENYYYNQERSYSHNYPHSPPNEQYFDPQYNRAMNSECDDSHNRFYEQQMLPHPGNDYYRTSGPYQPHSDQLWSQAVQSPQYNYYEFNKNENFSSSQHKF